MEPLRREGKQRHADQVAMWLALHAGGIPFAPLPSNLNYSLYVRANPQSYRPELPIGVIHYHDTLEVTGLISPVYTDSPAALFEAVKTANEQIQQHFHNKVFWDFRYTRWPERGSGIGSRGEPLQHKRRLLRAEGIESAKTILDVGCGDFEVLRPFQLNNYVGLDTSKEALERATQARPDLAFRRMDMTDSSIVPAELVLCFEVLIHQTTEEAYRRLITFLAEKTQEKLLVSGYDGKGDLNHHMIFYYEPLKVSLQRTGRFRQIETIGSHTSVKILRCLAAK